MPHYALINADNIVYDVITGVDENDKSKLPKEFSSWEDFYKAETGAHLCKRTSYNTSANQHTKVGTAFRGNYAGVGDTWDEEKEVFYAPQPTADHVLDTDTFMWIPKE